MACLSNIGSQIKIKFTDLKKNTLNINGTETFPQLKTVN
ncbi:hypothetical protein CLW00_10160 [Mongoliibacter ruber]|uniref:Uncharacterized protein n=1 Tax=Mongoliibacter ruber TaxID=1750599 RepID=A0A2T0WUM7_9BACT|nr:hypothetical protein CLW00_10160 [Mongoliibacter ruber]